MVKEICKEYSNIRVEEVFISRKLNSWGNNFGCDILRREEYCEVRKRA